MHVRFLKLIDVSSGNQNLKLGEKALYLTTFYVRLADTDMQDYHLEPHSLDISFREK